MTVKVLVDTMSAPNYSLNYYSDKPFPETICYGAPFDVLLSVDPPLPCHEIQLNCCLLDENRNEVILADDISPISIDRPTVLKLNLVRFFVTMNTVSFQGQKFILKVESNPTEWMISPFLSSPFTITMNDGMYNPFKRTRPVVYDDAIDTIRSHAHSILDLVGR